MRSVRSLVPLCIFECILIALQLESHRLIQVLSIFHCLDALQDHFHIRVLSLLLFLHFRERVWVILSRLLLNLLSESELHEFLRE